LVIASAWGLAQAVAFGCKVERDGESNGWCVENGAFPCDYQSQVLHDAMTTVVDCQHKLVV